MRFLRDELDWPIETEDFEDLTFDYTAEELGIDAANAAKIDEIKRLRPLVSGQPWGVFFVRFEPKQLPVVALRRILAGVVLRKRATASSAEQPKWREGDLLFISNYGEGAERRISFAHFSKDPAKNDLPTLKVIAWDELDTPLHLRHTADLLAERLAWPSPEEQADAEIWRDRWRSAFELRHREVISTSKALAERLAELARRLRVELLRVLEIEAESGRVTQLMETFRDALVHDMDADGFADMYAQTIAYGLLSARITDPGAATTDDLGGHMRTNPFLRELMETFVTVGGRDAGAAPGVDFDELGVSEVIQVLDDANMEAVIRDFGDRNPLEDPVMHFYELFLASYDPEKRLKRGVFYTPRPIVAAMVRRVHERLRNERGIADGLADPSVSVLDPAVGTGTFLVETVGLIHETLKEKWLAEGATADVVRAKWNEYVARDLLPRVYGFEIMMAPYAIAHLKIGLKLQETGYAFESDERVNVVLTDSLEPQARAAEQLELVVPAMAHEAEVARAAKSRKFSVVIGNPPYRNNSDRTLAQVAARFPRLLESSRLAAQAQVRNIRDDYAWFFSAADGYAEADNGTICLVTSDSYARIASYRFFREQVLHRFDVHALLLLGRSVFREVSPRISFAILELTARGPGDAKGAIDSVIPLIDIRSLADDLRPAALATPEDPRLQLLSDFAKGAATMPEPVEHFPSGSRGWSFLPLGTELVEEVLSASLPIFEKAGERIFYRKWPGIITAFDDLLKAADRDVLAERMEGFFEAAYEPESKRVVALEKWREASGISERWRARAERIAADVRRNGVKFSQGRIKRSFSGSIPNELRWWPPPAYRHYLYYEPRIKIPRNANPGKDKGWGSMEQWRDDAAHRISPKLIFTTSTNPRSGYKAVVVDDEWFVKLHGGTSQQYHFTGLTVGDGDLLGDSHDNLTGRGAEILQQLHSFGLESSALLHLIAAVYNSSLAESFLGEEPGEQLRIRVPMSASAHTCVDLVRQARRLRSLHQLLYDGQAQESFELVDEVPGLVVKDDGVYVAATSREGDHITDAIRRLIEGEQEALDALVASYYGLATAG